MRRLFLFVVLSSWLVYGQNPVRYDLRATGKTRAVKESSVLVPAVTGQTGRLTIAMIVPSGTMVKAGDVIAQFDPSQMIDLTREAKTKLEDMASQADQRAAEGKANQEKREQEMVEAKAEFSKAELQLRKGPVLPELERMQAEIRLEDARQRVASLEKSQKLRAEVDATSRRVLELKRDRQRVAVERGLKNLERMEVKALLDGMVSVDGVYRGSAIQPYQVGDTVSPGQALLRIFDPSQMYVMAAVGEQDGKLLKPGTVVDIRLDAYPDLALTARLLNASPVAAAGSYGSPIRQFATQFLLDKVDKRVLPDMAVAVIFRGDAK